MPKIVDHDARRRELVEAGFEVFDALGYGAVSMRKLAQGLGVTTGTLYHYFDGKEAIFREVVRQRFERDLAEATASIPEDASAEGRLLGLARWVGDHRTHLQATIRLVLDYQRQGGAGAFVVEVLDGYEAPLREALGGQRSGPALSLLLGLLVQDLLRGEEGDVSDHLRVLARMLPGA